MKTFAYFAIYTLLLAPLFTFAQVTTPPDNGALGTAINTGSTAQVKTGDLSVNAFSAMLTSYFASKLGVGTASILATLDVTPTITSSSDLKNIKSGLIYNGLSALTNYYATYIAAPTGSGSITNTYALVTEPSAGKVGIGTITPASQLSVNGGIQMGDDTSACTSTNVGTMRWHASSLEVCNGTAWAGTAAPATCVSGQYCGMIVYYTVYGQATTYASPWGLGDRKIKNGYGCISVTGAVMEASGCDKVFRTTHFTTDVYNYNGSNPPTNFGAPAASYIGGTVAQPVISCPVGSTYKEIGVSEASATNFPVPFYPSGTDVWLPNSANEVTDPLVKTVHIGTCLKQ